MKICKNCGMSHVYFDTHCKSCGSPLDANSSPYLKTKRDNWAIGVFILMILAIAYGLMSCVS